jgi:hypothetical protein
VLAPSRGFEVGVIRAIITLEESSVAAASMSPKDVTAFQKALDNVRARHLAAVRVYDDAGYSCWTHCVAYMRGRKNCCRSIGAQVKGV